MSRANGPSGSTTVNRVRTRLAALPLLALAAAGCMGGGSSPTSSQGSGSAVPAASTLPQSGTARLPDGIVYTVAAPGATLRLDNLTLRILGVTWRRSVTGATAPPGTRMFAVVRVRLANTSSTEPGTVTPTQIWLRSTLNRTYLASGASDANDRVIGSELAPGQGVTGALVFPVPGKLEGGLLVYRFGDTPAKARHVGIARLS
jgi:Domain of unknown function (DUF4352)